MASKLWYFGPTGRYATIKDAALADRLTWSATGPADNISDVAAIISHVLSLRSKIVTGYRGAGDMSLAVMRNEVDSGILSADSALPLVLNQSIKPVALFSPQRWHHLPDVPTLRETAALPAEGEDLGFELRAGLAGLAVRNRGVIFEAPREAGCLGARQPAPDGLFANPEDEGRVAQGKAELMVIERHLRSRQRGEFGISVHVARAVWRWVECSSTTSLPNASRADNVLKHDT
jgi:hypothetical protein